MSDRLAAAIASGEASLAAVAGLAGAAHKRKLTDDNPVTVAKKRHTAAGDGDAAPLAAVAGLVAVSSNLNGNASSIGRVSVRNGNTPVLRIVGVSNHTRGQAIKLTKLEAEELWCPKTAIPATSVCVFIDQSFTKALLNFKGPDKAAMLDWAPRLVIRRL